MVNAHSILNDWNYGENSDKSADKRHKVLATENEYYVDKKVLHNNWLIDKIVVVKVKEGLPAMLEYSNSNSIFGWNFELSKSYLESRSAAYEQLKLECWLLYQKSL